MVCNYLLYLQVSGQFHMACGMLHLFGFQLPETHHHYLLATGFTDYWRRINIYWKDFMVRVFFNPVVFRLKRWPQPAALAVATVVGLPGHVALACLPVVLAAGEAGAFRSPTPCSGGSWACLVLVNVQLDARRSSRGRARRPLDGAEPAHAWRSWPCDRSRSAATFTTIAVLWSLWSSPSSGGVARDARPRFSRDHEAT